MAASRGTLLVVDDDDALRETLGLEFEDRGYRVLLAANSSDACRLALLKRPEFAIVDLRIGQEKGLELLEQLLRIVPEVHAVVLTGYGSIATAVQAIKLGAWNYLTKPIEPDALEQALHQQEADASVAAPDDTPSLASHEREYIEYVLASTGGNISEAARRLGLHRQSLQRKLRKYPPRR